MNSPVLQCEQVYKHYKDGNNTVEVLSGLELSIAAGERVAIVGPSGSGKSTLLHLMGGLDRANQGTCALLGTDWQSLSEKQRCLQRNAHLGFIYQFHHLLPEFTALENAAMPLLIGKMDRAKAFMQAEDLLSKVGLAHRLKHKPAQLSGGERQRVAIARALVGKPSCILADEPTGNLDHSTAASVFAQMMEINAEDNCALVIVTHDTALAAKMDRCLTLQDGQLRAVMVEGE